MKTFMASPATIERKWYVVDAEGKTLGRLASEVAKVLRGKNKAIFTPHIDTGDYVIVVNAEKIKVTGKKMEQKIFHCEIVVDNARVAAETKAYKPIPVITDFTGRDGKDHMREEIERNYYRIKEEVGGIIQKELRRIENDPNLKHLLETEDDG